MCGVGSDCIPALHDAVLNHRVVSNINIVQDDGILNHTVIAHICLFKENGILNRAV